MRLDFYCWMSTLDKADEYYEYRFHDEIEEVNIVNRVGYSY